MKRRRKSTFALVAVLAVVAAACGGGGGNKGKAPSPTGSLSGTTITFSDSLAESEVPAVQDLLSQFHDQTGVTVKLTAVTAQDRCRNWWLA